MPDMPPFEEQDRPEKVKRIYRALKREYGESMPAEVKARIASRKGSSDPEERKSGPPYSDPIHYKRKGDKYVKKSYSIEDLKQILRSISSRKELEQIKEVMSDPDIQSIMFGVQRAFKQIMDVLRRKAKTQSRLYLP